MNNAPGVHFRNHHLEGSFLHTDMQFFQWMINAKFALLQVSLSQYTYIRINIHIYLNFN